MKSLLLLPVFLSGFGAALADWSPDMSLSQAWMDYEGPGMVSLFVTPDGSGEPFSEAMVEYGFPVNATLHLQLFDMSGLPIPGFPAEDLWLEATDGGLIPCALGTCADRPTDADGQASWMDPLHAGGNSESPCQVLVMGMSLHSPGLDLHFNSTDLNGDLVVNLSDVSIFAGDFFGAYNYRSDFYFDGVVNLADVSLLALGMNAQCP